MAQFCAAATGPPGRLAWSIIPPPLTQEPVAHGSFVRGANLVASGTGQGCFITEDRFTVFDAVGVANGIELVVYLSTEYDAAQDI